MYPIWHNIVWYHWSLFTSWHRCGLNQQWTHMDVKKTKFPLLLDPFICFGDIILSIWTISLGNAIWKRSFFSLQYKNETENVHFFKSVIRLGWYCNLFLNPTLPHFYITYITRYLWSFQRTEVVVDFHQLHNITEMESYWLCTHIGYTMDTKPHQTQQNSPFQIWNNIDWTLMQ